MRIGIVLLYLQYIAGVLGAGRYVIDRISCSGTLYNSVKGYMDTVQQWATDICNPLEPYIEDPTPANRPDETFMNLVAGHAYYADGLGRFDAMRQYVLVDVDNRSEWWKNSEREQSDLELFCNPDYIIWKNSPVDGSVTWWDPTRYCPIKNDNMILDLKLPSTHLLAVSCPAIIDGNQERWPVRWSETITFQPQKLQNTIDKDVTFNAKRVQKALAPSLFSRIKHKFKRTGKSFKPVDLLDTTEMTLVHEPPRDVRSFNGHER
ncbi:hypothetical protein PG997_000649 [Apiospora hydei]|uniref:Uncharacterized protein n=1 Tax=Apiospora hydei TaxID=1337664 RepID=A0ABR1XBJ6_9PEZI